MIQGDLGRSLACSSATRSNATRSRPRARKTRRRAAFSQASTAAPEARRAATRAEAAPTSPPTTRTETCLQLSRTACPSACGLSRRRKRRSSRRGIRRHRGKSIDHNARQIEVTRAAKEVKVSKQQRASIDCKSGDSQALTVGRCSLRSSKRQSQSAPSAKRSWSPLPSERTPAPGCECAVLCSVFRASLDLQGYACSTRVLSSPGQKTTGASLPHLGNVADVLVHCRTSHLAGLVDP